MYIYHRLLNRILPLHIIRSVLVRVSDCRVSFSASSHTHKGKATYRMKTDISKPQKIYSNILFWPLFPIFMKFVEVKSTGQVFHPQHARQQAQIRCQVYFGTSLLGSIPPPYAPDVARWANCARNSASDMFLRRRSSRCYKLSAGNITILILFESCAHTEYMWYSSYQSGTL